MKAEGELLQSVQAHQIQLIREEIAAACKRAGRAVSDITLVAVSKTVSAARMQNAIALGLTVMGENRVQEAEAKIQELQGQTIPVQWHLIGHLQSNKVRKAVALFDVIQSVDSYALAVKLNRVAEELGKRLPVMVEVNLAEEVSKSGVGPQETLPLVEQINQLPSLQLQGLMTVPPFLDDPEAVRPFFRQLGELRYLAVHNGIVDETFRELSMGMSNDFAVAIEEGATIVRIGTALFGQRN